jgi:hypothetical protein
LNFQQQITDFLVRYKLFDGQTKQRSEGHGQSKAPRAKELLAEFWRLEKEAESLMKGLAENRPFVHWTPANRRQ